MNIKERILEFFGQEYELKPCWQLDRPCAVKSLGERCEALHRVKKTND